VAQSRTHAGARRHPGFRRGRRYIARYGTPEFFTLYEADSAEVLVGQDYLNRLNNPTPLTQRVPPNFFRDTSRGVCRVKLSLGVGQGGLHAHAALGRRGGAGSRWNGICATRAAAAGDIVAVVGVHLCLADRGERHQTTERGDARSTYPNWLVMIERRRRGPDEAATGCSMAISPPRCAAEMERGLYTLEFCR
jgi:hypothetical protein